LSQLQHLADFDLVERLFNCPSLDDHILHKVKAHVDPHTVSHLLTAYHTLGNQLVNDKAIQACWNFLPELVHEYHALHLQYELEKEQLTFYYRFLLELSASKTLGVAVLRRRGCSTGPDNTDEGRLFHFA